VAVGPRIPRNVLLVFGVASLLLAALYLFGQRDIKRLLAYSSVEHMGIMAIGISFGAPAAVAGVLLHVLAHAAAKGNAFLGAGVLVRKFGLKGLSAIRGGLDLLPWSGPLFLLAVFALGAMPPFGLFRSEFEIVAGGFATHGYAGATVLIIGVTVAFLGLAAALMPVLLEPARHAPAEAMPVRVHAAAAATPVTGTSPAATTGDGAVPVTGDGGQPGDAPAGPASPARGEPSTWMVLPVLAGVIVLLVLGIHPPAELNELFSRAVAMLTGRS
jgi:hydrogenase-4 component F